ncbi:MAG: DNA polymerase IV [Clostridia bacterium]|nr:DNA polymerase IV [Clostridia bacterium]
MTDRVILHCDCNGFYASVEQLKRPELKTVPMAVCGDPESRHGIILAKNELAKGFGIKTAETINEAKRKCPDLVLVPPHHKEYAHWSRVVNAIYARYTEQVEPFGIDESWLDVTGSTGLFGDGKTIADRLRKEVREETGLTISVGVSFNKIFAKLGSDHKKPDATTVIGRDDLSWMVWPKPVNSLLYVGTATELTLRSVGIRTIGQLALSDPEMLELRLGKLGRQLWEYANGLEHEPVASVYDKRPVKSVGNGMTFRRDLVGEADVRLGVNALSDEVATRLRKAGMKCRTVQLTIKDPGLRSITRQKSVGTATDLAHVLSACAMELWRDNWDPRAPIRMLTVTGQNLVTPDEDVEQLMLFEEADTVKRKKQAGLERAMDAIRGKYGAGAIHSAGLLGNDLGISTDPEHENEKPSEFGPEEG